MSKVGLVLGHSFVAGLAQSIAHANGVVVASLQPQQIALVLKAEVHFDKIYLAGRRGARAEDLRGLFLELLNVHNHPHVDYVVVDCGSNDIVHKTPALDVAATI